jgi:hypothetical protein
MKKLTDIDKKMDSMLNESIKKTSNPLNEGWFDIVTQGALIITVVLWTFQAKGYTLNAGGLKKAWGDIKKAWKTMRMDKELVRIITKLSNDAEVLQAAKEKVVGPRGGKRPKYESEKVFREFLKKKIGAADYKTLYMFTRDWDVKKANRGKWTSQQTYDGSQ